MFFIVILDFCQMYIFFLLQILINLIYFYENMKMLKPTSNIIHSEPNTTLLVLVIIQCIYLLDGIYFEKTWVTSFEIQYEGFGHMSAVGYFIYPFMSSALAKYVFDYNVKLENWKLTLSVLLFFVGYVFFRGSNSQKDFFRQNPNHPLAARKSTLIKLQ